MTDYRPIAALAQQAAGVLAAAGVTAKSYSGTRFLAENHAPPRYVWVATSDTFNEGAEKRETDTAYTASEVVAIFCWGKTADEAYRMRNNMMVALKASCGAAVTFPQSGWLKDTEESVKQRGAVYQLNATFQVPVPNRIVPDDTSTSTAPDVEILGTEQDLVMVFPSGEEASGG